MKKDIMVIRESIGRVVSMLTNQSIKVLQRGSRAYVRYHPKTGEIVEMNIPYIPDDASEEFVAAIQGFLDHEVGHVLYSDFSALQAAHKEGKRVANLANLVEDVFVERKMAEAFRGSGVNLESVRKFYLEKIARPKIEAALKAGNTEEAAGYATVAAFRAWGGQTTAADFIKEPKIAALIAPVEAKLSKELKDALLNTKSSSDCLELARKFKKALEKPKEPPPPPTPPSPPPPAEASPGEGEPDDSDDGEAPEDKGTSKAESDDSGKERTEPEELDKLDDSTDAGDEGGKEASDKDEAGDPDAKADDSTPADEPTDEGTGEPAADSGEPEGEDEPEGESKGSTPDDEDGDDAESDAGGEADGAGEEDDEGAADDEPGSAGGDAAGDEESGSEESKAEGDAGGEDSGEADAGEGPIDEEGESTPSGAPGAPDEPPEPDPIADMFDTERDFDKDMSERLSTDAKEELEHSKYSVFSQEWDRIEPARLSTHPKTVERLDEQLRDKVGVMQKSLERAMAAQARKTWNPGQRRGRIAPGSLFKTAAGDDRVFRTRFETKAKNTAVSLVIDCSGSMGCGRIDLAGVAAFALATVLERLRLNYEVIGFTAYDSSEMIQLIKDDAEYHGKTISGMGWGRVEPLYMPVFKPFGGRLDTQARSRIAHLTESPNWLHQNIDGECVQIAGRRLKQQRAERHVMIVLSDGQPSAMCASGLSAHLKRTVKELTAQNIEVIGMGIQTDVVKQFYPKNVVINNVEELPTRVMAELTRLLLAP